MTGLKELVILYSTSSSSSIERISNIPCLEHGEVNFLTYGVWSMIISSRNSSWRKSLSFNSSSVRRLLISVESQNDYLISASNPFESGYLVAQDGNGTFSIASTLAFYGEVHFILFATTTASHTPIRPMTSPATQSATGSATPTATGSATPTATTTATPATARSRTPDGDSQTPLPLRTRSESATRTSAIWVSSKSLSQAVQSPVAIATASPSSVGFATQTPIPDSTQNRSSKTTRSREPIPTPTPI
jgi:hypothetical protein